MKYLKFLTLAILLMPTWTILRESTPVSAATFAIPTCQPVNETVTLSSGTAAPPVSGLSSATYGWRVTFTNRGGECELPSADLPVTAVYGRRHQQVGQTSISDVVARPALLVARGSATTAQIGVVFIHSSNQTSCTGHRVTGVVIGSYLPMWPSHYFALPRPLRDCNDKVAAVSEPLSLAAAPCTAYQVEFGFGPEISPATGEQALAFTLSNLSRSSCTVTGAPRVMIRGARGVALAFHYVSRSQYFANLGWFTQVIRPHQRAYFIVAKYRCDRGDLVSAESMSTTLYLDASRTIRHTFTGAALDRTLRYCRGGPTDPGQYLAVSPMVPRIALLLP